MERFLCEENFRVIQRQIKVSNNILKIFKIELNTFIERVAKGNK